jgi:putative glycosyltransferase (TIGR04348 family)
MNIALVTPAAPHTRYGNRNTAVRWARMLRATGHRVRVEVEWDGRPAEAMIALHARRSHDSIRRYAQAHPDRPLVVVLTGTDLYRDIAHDADAQASLELATRLVVLHELVDRRLAAFRDKVRVVYQSAQAVKRPAPLASCFEVVVSGHLRAEKDPFRAAAACAHLPATSRTRVTHLGGARDAAMAKEAARWMKSTARYRWLGERAHGEAVRKLARARLMVISSIMEGGANVVCEALAVRTPVIASRIPGNVGMLGTDYAGYYECGNEHELARLMFRAETDAAFYRTLQQQCALRRPLVSPSHERAALKRVVDEVARLTAKHQSSGRCAGPSAASSASRTGAKLRR